MQGLHAQGEHAPLLRATAVSLCAFDENPESCQHKSESHYTNPIRLHIHGSDTNAVAALSQLNFHLLHSLIVGPSRSTMSHSPRAGPYRSDYSVLPSVKYLHT